MRVAPRVNADPNPIAALMVVAYTPQLSLRTQRFL
jgi:hypothetical protein